MKLIFKTIPVRINDDGTIERGNVPKIDKEFLETVSQLMGEGFTHKDLAAYFRVDYVEWLRLMKARPEVVEHANFGRTQGLRFGIKCLTDQMLAGNPKSTIFYLTHVHKWSDNSRLGAMESSLSQSGTSELPMVSDVTTDPIEAARVYQKFITGS